MRLSRSSQFSTTFARFRRGGQQPEYNVSEGEPAAGRQQFKGEVIGVVANVLNLYYGLVADYEDLKAKQSAVEVAQQFFENNKKQVELGTHGAAGCHHSRSAGCHHSAGFGGFTNDAGSSRKFS